MSSITVFFIFIPLLAFILLVVNLVFAPHNAYQEKDSAFECGFHSFLGQNRTQFSISFFIFALLFLLFDLEILLVYPYIVSAYNNSIYGLIIMLIFFLVLTLGFAFELGKNALKINSRQMYSIYNKQQVVSNFIASLIPTRGITTQNPKTASLCTWKNETIRIYLRYVMVGLILILTLSYVTFLWLVAIAGGNKDALDCCVSILHLSPQDLSISYLWNIFIYIPYYTLEILKFVYYNSPTAHCIVVTLALVVIAIMLINLFLTRNKGSFSFILTIIKTIYKFICNKDLSAKLKINFIINIVCEITINVKNFISKNFYKLIFIIAAFFFTMFITKIFFFYIIGIEYNSFLAIFMIICSLPISSLSFLIISDFVFKGKV